MHPTSLPFADWMKAIAAHVEQSLEQFLPNTLTTPARLHEAMRYATLDGGKRVRPLLVYAAGQLFDADQDALARAACGVEMIHAYSLVHDDMPCMDDDALRRGKPTVHVKYDEASALLVGDALQAQAFILLSQGSAALKQPARALQRVQVLAHAAGSVGMCGGQAIDLASVGKSLSLEELEQMHRLKTGAILQAAVILGALCGSGDGGGDGCGKLSATEMESLQAYAKAVGLAFQVVDDVLDATADSATLGKTAGKDAMDNKPTYVSILGLEPSKALALQLQQDAHAALLPFGEKAQRLRELADLVVQRKA